MGRTCKETVSSICLVPLIACCLPLMAACGGWGSDDSEPESASAATDLTIEVWPQGPSGESHTWTLTCSPAGGSLPDAEQACSRLKAEALQPLPPDIICTQIYGGPETARVRGRIEGDPIDVTFNRVNGCEIHRWDTVAFLFQ
jgi:Subtilisin inhibitor-like